MAWLNALNLRLAFGHWALLDGTDFSLEKGERVGLIGRNGTGKSSLLKILAGLERADDGERNVADGVRLVYLPQEPVFDAQARAWDVVADGLGELRALHQRLQAADTPESELAAVHEAIEAINGWTFEAQVDAALQRVGLQPDARVGTLSGGQHKRLALAQAWVQQPQVLLLDEPTNHLDIDSIDWLADLLKDSAGALMFVTHDRHFLDSVATRIVELDRGQLRSYPGNFTAYQTRKAEQLRDETLANARFDKLLAQEEVWIRKGVEARRTRSVARVERLMQLRRERSQRRDVQGNVRLALDAGERSGKIVAELENISKSYGERTLVRDFSTTLMRGDKVALIGANGVGKTTLLKLILGEVEPDAQRPGEPEPKRRLGSNLSVAYFDQMRDGLDLDATLEDFISPGSEWIEIGGKRQHVKSYLGDFLFAPQRATSPVRSLSGGERNRLLLARLFARPANVLVLDEPTNDLDIETLELLEELLADYNGTVFLVSHDRAFVDNIATSIIACEASDAQPGFWREYVGSVQDWLTQRARSPAAAPLGASSSAIDLIAKEVQSTTTYSQKDAKTKKKLSYKEQKELEALPARMEALEAEQKAIRTQLADGQLYATDHVRAAALAARDSAIEDELMACLERMEALV